MEETADKVHPKPKRPKAKKLTEEASKVGGNGEDTIMGGMEGKEGFEDMERMERSHEDYDGSDLEHDRSEEEETDLDEDWDERTGEPNIIYNEDATTYWGRCYFEALQQDPDFGESTILREPFYRNAEGFILKRHHHQPSRVYILKGKVRIGGELYDMREMLVHSAHGRLRHFGLSKTYHALRRETIWTGQWEQTKKLLQRCDACQRGNQPTQKPAGIAQMVQVPDRAWESIAIDVLGPLPLSANMRHVLVVVDRFSSAVRLVPMQDKYTARDICDALLTEIYARLGTPKEIISDRGPQLVSNYFTEMQDAFGINLLHSTAFHQNTNGSAERTVKTVTHILRKYTNKRQNDWRHHLWRCEHAINNASTDWTHRTPLEICMGTVNSGLTHSTSKSDAVNKHLEHMDISNKIAHDALTMSRYKQARWSQGRRNPNITFDIGDLVMYQRRTFTKGLAHKLQDIWKGPYKVTSVDSHGNCTLDIPGNQRHPIFATDMLKHYHDDPEHKREPSDVDMDDADAAGFYVIDRIIDHRTKNGKYQYLVSWKGYDEDENTWEEAFKIEEDAPQATIDFHQMLSKEPRHAKRIAKRRVGS